MDTLKYVKPRTHWANMLSLKENCSEMEMISYRLLKKIRELNMSNLVLMLWLIFAGKLCYADHYNRVKFN